MGRAVAIDLGASSARFALGSLIDGKIEFEIIEQIPHKPREWNGHDVWDIDLLFGFCERALKFAKDNGAKSIGIDTWGVDHGFVDANGNLVQPPICYRDHSHAAMFERMKEHRPWLYAQTGIQHQPFNTLYQLLARKEDSPHLFEPKIQWLLLPDLFLHLLGADRGYERSIASSTQLTGADGNWNGTVFERFGLTIPPSNIVGPGIIGERDGVKLIRVAGHDTASAVLGMGNLDHAVFANLGTWALIGKLTDYCTDAMCAEFNLSNERTTDNQVRLLANIPGFYIINRLHEEIEPEIPLDEWLTKADLTAGWRLRVEDPMFFNPDSMLQAAIQNIGPYPRTSEQWAGIALNSLSDAMFATAIRLGYRRVRLTGGGSKCEILCRLITESWGAPVLVGPAEATIFGNLALQFANGSCEEATRLVDASLDLVTYA